MVAKLAAAQDGVVGRAQLMAAGLTARMVDVRVRSGLLIPLYRGVYAVGSPIVAPRARLRAALLAVGPASVLSHWSAAWMHALTTALGKEIHLTSLVHRRNQAGIVVHRASVLPADENAEVDGLPCTSVARTLVDLAGAGSRRQVERGLDRAEFRRTYDGFALEAAMRRGRTGSRALREAIGVHAPGTTATRNRMEELYLEICRGGGLQPDALNVPMTLCDGTEIVIDALFARARVAVELDGRDAHARERAFERDRHRDAELLSMGFLPLRFTWRKLTREPGWVLDKTRAAVAARSF